MQIRVRGGKTGWKEADFSSDLDSKYLCFAFLQNKGFPPKTKQGESQPTHIRFSTSMELAVPSSWKGFWIGFLARDYVGIMKKIVAMDFSRILPKYDNMFQQFKKYKIAYLDSLSLPLACEKFDLDTK